MTDEPITADLAVAVAEQQEARVRAKVLEVAANLRESADRIEREVRREAPPDPGSPVRGRTRSAYLVSRAAHEVAWMTANLSLDVLARDAAEADVYRAIAQALEVSPTVPE